MTVDDRVVLFLKQNKGKAYCDACIALHVARPEGGHINKVQASNATRPLRKAGSFLVGPAECSECREHKQKVTQAI